MKKLVFFSSFNRTLFPHLHKDKTKPHPCLHREWIENRFKIWHKYTLPSILRQKWEDFIYVVCCHPDSRRDIEEVFAPVTDSRVIISYSFSDHERGIIDNIASQYSEIYHTRIDSDDMYHPLAGLELMQKDTPKKWLFWRRGYIYLYRPNAEKENGKMFLYDCRGTGPFMCHRYTSQEYAKKDVIKEIAHKLVAKKGPARLPGGRFIVGITGQNTSTPLSSKSTGQKLWGAGKAQIMTEFGIPCWDSLSACSKRGVRTSPKQKR